MKINTIINLTLSLSILLICSDSFAGTTLSHSWQGGQLNNPPITIRDAKSLKKKEKVIERLLSKEWISPEGLIYSMVMFETNHRITQNDVLTTAPAPKQLEERDLAYVKERLEITTTNGKPQYLLQGIPLEDVESYEDSLRSTSTYLSGLFFKYQVTHDKTILKQAGKIFQALYSVYELGMQEQRGWVPKPYGFRCTKQASIDNQAPYYMSLLRYYKIAPENDQKRIQQVITDLADYWIRNNYHMHLPYFGMDVDYATNKYYPDHWQLLVLPLIHGAWKVSGNPKYKKEFERLTSQLDMTKDSDPEYLQKKIRAFHRWFLQYAWLLELEAPHKKLWMKGLSCQRAAMPEMEFHHEFAFSQWLDSPKEQQSMMKKVKRDMLHHDLRDYLVYWPPNSYIPKTRAFLKNTIYTLLPAIWFEKYWQGRYLGYWNESAQKISNPYPHPLSQTEYRNTPDIPLFGTIKWKVQKLPFVDDGPNAGISGMAMVAHQGKIYISGGVMPSGNKSGDKNARNTSKYTHCYDPITGKWTQLPDMPEAREYVRGISTHDAIYIVGGAIRSHQPTPKYMAKNDCFRLDTKTHKWTRHSKLTCARTHTSVGNAGKYLIAIGGNQYTLPKGYDQSTVRNVVDIFDLTRPELGWQQKNPIPGSPRGWMGAAVVGKEIYVFGGVTFLSNGNVKRFHDTLRYNPATDQWTKLADAPFIVGSWDGDVYLDRYIILTGGVAGDPANSEAQLWNDMLFVYDTQINRWYKMATPLPVDAVFGDPGICIIDNTIYIAGGEGPESSHFNYFIIGDISPNTDLLPLSKKSPKSATQQTL